MIRIVVVGSGGSVPAINRSLPCIALKYDKVFLFDIGEGTQRELMRNNIPYGSVDAVFITHLHLDHFLGLYGLLETLEMMEYKGTLKIFAPIGFRMLKRFSFVEEIPIANEGEIYRFRDFTVSAFKTLHDNNSYGFKVKFDDKRIFDKKKLEKYGIKGIACRKLLEQGIIQVKDQMIKLEEVSSIKKEFCMVYSGDTMLCESVIENSIDADLLFHDCSYMPSEHEYAKERKHSSLIDCVEVLKKTKAKKMILMHISSRYTNAQIRAEVEKVEKQYGIEKGIIVPAEDGLEILRKY